MIAIIATIFVELGSMFPETGGMVRYGYYSHGRVVGFVTGWANWISIVSVIPVEAEGSVQYMTSWRFSWAHSLYIHNELSAPGLILAAALVVGYFLLNYWGVKLYTRFNSYVTVFKIAVPLLTAGSLLLAGFHSSNFMAPVNPGAARLGLPAILAAISTSGVIFSFNGFQSPINLAGEARNPAVNIPFAVFGSIGLTALIYITLQIAFLGGVNPKSLAGGWAGLNMSSPFSQLALALNLNWLAVLLYADAFVSPSGTGATYTATTSRMIYAMQRSGSLPRVFGQVDLASGVPRPAMWLNLVVSFVFLFFFRGWGPLAAVISVATIISYQIGPSCVAGLRRTAPDLKRPLRTPAVSLIAPLAFTLGSLLLYFARWPLTGGIILLIIVSLPIYVWSEAKRGWKRFSDDLRGALWLIVYLPFMALVSACGSRKFGGVGLIPYGWDLGLVAVVSYVFYRWSEASAWRTPALLFFEKDEALPVQS